MTITEETWVTCENCGEKEMIGSVRYYVSVPTHGAAVSLPGLPDGWRTWPDDADIHLTKVHHFCSERCRQEWRNK